MGKLGEYNLASNNQEVFVTRVPLGMSSALEGFEDEWSEAMAEEPIESAEDAVDETGENEFEEENVDDVADDPLIAVGSNEDEEFQAVSVVVRIRPLLDDEVTGPDGAPTTVAVTLPYASNPNLLRAIAKEGTPSEAVLECGYDCVLPMLCAQADVFERTGIKPAVLGVAKGVSACVFAYGQVQ